MAEALAKAQQILLATGITATADMGTSIADWAAMNQAGRTGRLSVRIMAYSSGVGPIATIAPNGPSSWLYADRLQLGGVKLYSDGALGSRGAFLKQPYADQPDTHGGRKGVNSTSEVYIRNMLDAWQGYMNNGHAEPARAAS